MESGFEPISPLENCASPRTAVFLFLKYWAPYLRRLRLILPTSFVRVSRFGADFASFDRCSINRGVVGGESLDCSRVS